MEKLVTQLEPKNRWVSLRFIQILLAVVGIFTLMIWVVAASFNLDGISTIALAVMAIILPASAVVRSSGRFYKGQINRLGFITEMSFIFGVVILILGMCLDVRYSIMGLVAFSFLASPLLAIINRIISLKQKKVKNVASTITEIIIFAAFVVTVTWLLVGFSQK